MKKARASIKLRIVAILCIVLFCSVGVSAFSAYRFFWPSFQEIEQNLARQNAHRVKNALLHDLDTLSVFVNDWALWDDSYNFVRYPNDIYVNSNLAPETFWQNNLTGIAYLDAGGDMVWARSYDFKSEDFDAFPAEVSGYIVGLLQAQGGLPADGLDGIVRIGDGYAHMAARGIRDTRANVPAYGAIIMLRQIDEAYFDRLRMDMRTYFHAEPNMAFAVADGASDSSILTEDVRTVWFDLPVLNDEGGLRFYVETSRAVSATAERALVGDIVAVLIGSVIVFIVMLIVLEKQLVMPLSRLSRGLIERQNNPMARLALNRGREDEIGLIAKEVDRLQVKIIEMALKDNLTELPNRRLFDDRLEHSVERADRRNTHVAVIFIDLDGFKPVNDKYGHQEGDKLLRKVSDRFRKVVRGSDTLARFGGDEFAMVSEFRKDPRTGLNVLCSKLMQQLEEPFMVKGHPVRITASFGCAIYPEQARDTVELVRMADEAMYVVKARGKAGWMIYGDDANQNHNGGGHDELPHRIAR